MALLPEVEKIIKEYQDPAEQKAAREFYELYPKLQEQLKAQVLAQSDYSRKVQEATEKGKAADARKAEADALYTKNVQWFEDSQKDVAALEDQNKKLQSDLEKAQKLAQKAGEGGAPPAEMAKWEQTITAMQKTLEDTQKALKESNDKVSKDFDRGAMWLITLNDITNKHQQTFGEVFNQGEFVKYMNENKLADPNEAYKTFTEAKRQAKWEADKTIEIQKKIEAENAAKTPQPYANGQGVIEPGPLQRFIARDDKAPKSTSEAVMRAAEELVSEGKR